MIFYRRLWGEEGVALSSNNCLTSCFTTLPELFTGKGCFCRMMICGTLNPAKPLALQNLTRSLDLMPWCPLYCSAQEKTVVSIHFWIVCFLNSAQQRYMRLSGIRKKEHRLISRNGHGGTSRNTTLLPPVWVNKAGSLIKGMPKKFRFCLSAPGKAVRFSSLTCCACILWLQLHQGSYLFSETDMRQPYHCSCLHSWVLHQHLSKSELWVSADDLQ